MPIDYQLSKLLEKLGTLDNKVLSFLRPGLDKDEILEELKDNQLILPKDLIDFYTKLNGSTIKQGQKIGEYYIIPSFFPLSFQESLSLYQELFFNNPALNNFFPFLSSGGGDYIIISLNKDTYGQIYIYEYDGGLKLAFSDLEQMLKTYNQAFEIGLIKLDENTYLSTNYQDFFPFASKLNPTAEYWKV